MTAVQIEQRKIPPQLEYGSETEIFSILQPVVCTPQNGISSVTMDNVGGTAIRFLIPADCYNLSKSRLFATLNITADSADDSWIYADCWAMFRQIQLLSQTNYFLVDINNLALYTQLTARYDTPFLDILSKPSLYNVGGAAGTSGKGPAVTFPVNFGFLAPFVYQDNTCGTGATICNFTNISPAAGSVNLQQSNSYSPQNLIHMATTATFTITIDAELNGIKNCLFDYDKVLFYPQQLQLILWLNAYGNIGWNATSGNTPSATPIAYEGGTAGATPPVFSNIQLLLAQEQNAVVRKMLQDKVYGGGMKVEIDYVWQQSTPSSGTAQNTTLILNNGYGSRLRKIYHTITQTTGANNVLNHSNMPTSLTANSITNTYQVTLQNQVEVQQPINCVNNYNLDYQVNSQKFKGSLISSAIDYYYNWCHISTYDGLKTWERDDGSKVRGLPLGADPILYQFLGSNMVSQTTTHYDFFVCKRVLSLLPTGISISNE
jgi:hypothetical protein